MNREKISEDAPGRLAYEAALPSEVNLEHQRETLKHIIDIGASLRLGMDLNSLLKRVSEAICDALRFRYSVLYLADEAGNFHARAFSGLPSEQEIYLAEHPMPADVIQKLASDEYRMSASYFIPAGAPIWQDEYVCSFILVGDALAFPSSANAQPLLGPEWHPDDLLIIPLIGGDNSFLGFLTPDAPLNDRRPTLEMLTLFELFANQAAIVIEGARLYEELQRHSEERAALVEVGRSLAALEDPGDLQAIYQTIYKQVERMMPIDAFYIARYVHGVDHDSLWMDFLIDDGVKYPPAEFGPIRPGTYNLLFHEPVGRLLSTSQEYFTFANIDPALLEQNVIGSNRTSESILFVPIRYRDEVIGLFSAQCYQPYSYTQHHLELLKEIGVQSAIAFNNARLYTELREALKQAQQSERLKNHFLMTASHELRTPLTAIQGYLELLGDFGASLDEDSKTRFISNARRACEELVLLLGNVMDASRIDQDRVMLKQEPVRVIRAVLLVLEILEPILVREERALEVEIAEDLQVWVDELRLRQIFLNIVGNALKYTPIQSGIAISAKHLSWECLCDVQSQVPPCPPSGDFVVISIRDWGPGVSLDDQERLFTKFMRLPSALNSVQRGAGLGLYLCRQLTEAMGGTIWLESQGIPGEGVTFSIALPTYVEGKY